MAEVIRLDAAATAERASWLGMLEDASKEPFAHPAYVELFAGGGERAIALVVHDAEATWLVPLVERPLPAELGTEGHDLVSPYGYGGPFLVSGPADAVPPLHLVARYVGDEGYASAFLRLSLAAGERAASTPATAALVRDVAPNVVLALDVPDEARWQGYAHKVRKNVRKALRNGCTVTQGHDPAHWNAFHAIYAHTMGRRSAAERYRFDRAFFGAFHAELREYCQLYVTWDADGCAVSAELVLTSDRNAYSFLGGTLAEAFPLAPNDLLKHVAADEQALRGRSAFVLGGGYRPGDGIFRYKHSFAPSGEVMFRSTNLVGHPARYEELVRRREGVATVEDGFFPRYRA